MKTNIKILSISVLFTMGITLSAFNQDDKNKGNKQEQKQDKPKGQGKGNNGNKNNDKNDELKADRNNKNENKGNGNNGEKPGKLGNGKDKERGNNGNKIEKVANSYGYLWTNENFKERRNLRKDEKVTVCHKFNGNDEVVTISISQKALNAHINHGDVRGECPAVKDNKFSDIFLKRRSDYYNNLYETEEQVSYSRSILDYALERLAGSRLQLSSMYNNNMDLDEIERKKVTVMELEQNVSLLQTLLGVASNLIVNKLQQ